MKPPRRKRPFRPKVSAPPVQQAQGARWLAYDVLTSWQQRGAFAGRVLDDLCRERNVSGADRALALELSYSIIRRQATIDAVITAFVDRPRKNIEDGLWRLLQIGVCQLVLLDGIPPHAAVHETAELAKKLHKPQWTGLINGVLRSISTAVQPETTEPSPTRSVPIGNESFRTLDRDLFVSPEQDAADHLSKAHSFPRWLVRGWLERFGIEETTRICRGFNVPSFPSIRVNVLRQSPEVFQKTLKAAGVESVPGRFPESLIPESSLRPVDLPGFAEGWFSIQDESAMAAARLVDPQPGTRVLDMCAAPGGKTTHLAELMHNEGAVVSTDADADRLRLVTQSAERLGLSAIEVVTVSPSGEDLPAGPFDAVLVDVPCSNTGVLGKRPEARWRITPESIDELIPVQIRLLTQAIERVKPGGRVVYSTCSIDARENRGVVDCVLAANTQFTLDREINHIPGKPADGGYQALLKSQQTDRG